MKRLSDLKRYTPSLGYRDDSYVLLPMVSMDQDINGDYLKYSEVEPLVADLDDAFEHCKMDLESTKATVEELTEQLFKANERIKALGGIV